MKITGFLIENLRGSFLKAMMCKDVIQCHIYYLRPKMLSRTMLLFLDMLIYILKVIDD